MLQSVYLLIPCQFCLCTMQSKNKRQIYAIAKVLIILSLLGGFVAQVYNQVDKYLKGETVMTSNVIKSPALLMPDIILCPGYKPGTDLWHVPGKSFSNFIPERIFWPIASRTSWVLSPNFWWRNWALKIGLNYVGWCRALLKQVWAWLVVVKNLTCEACFKAQKRKWALKITEFFMTELSGQNWFKLCRHRWRIDQ